MSTRLDPLSEAITAGRGLPETVRVAARTLEASLLVTDDAGATIAIAARSSADERALMHGGPPVLAFDLRRGGRTVGRLRLRRPGRADPPPPGLLRVVRTLVAAEVERRGAGERSARAEEAALARALLGGNPPPDGTSVLADGAGVILVRASEPRLLLLVRRAARAVVHASAATAVDAPAGEARVALIVPAADDAAVRRAAEGIRQRLLRSEPGIRLAIGHSRRAAAPRDLERAGKEAALAAHLADGSRSRSRRRAHTGSCCPPGPSCARSTRTRSGRSSSTTRRTGPASSRRSRRSSHPTGATRRPRSASVRIATPCVTGLRRSAASPAWTRTRPAAASSSGSASRRCGSSRCPRSGWTGPVRYSWW